MLLVAAKKEKIADYTGVIAQAGRSAVVVDVDAFALQNAYEVNYGIEAGAVIVLLNAGASATNINILRAINPSSRATSRSAATPTPRRCRAS